jgi:Flp pilus assembly protein TadD
MRITWLMEAADRRSGIVRTALEDANWLAQRGHQVTVVSRSGPPSWMQLRTEFRTAANFHSEELPDADVLVATDWSTMPWAAGAEARNGVPVHLCRDYEGDLPESAALRDRIEAAYRLPGMHHITLAPNLTALLQARFELAPREIPFAIDHGVHFPGPERQPNQPLRVGLVGPYDIGWKGLATGYAACRLAHAAGQRLLLVRATERTPVATELEQPFAIEWHHQLPPARMGDLYRSLDVLLATSNGPEEGLFAPALEAMACGVPVVLTDVPCFRGYERQLGHAGFGLFVPPGDAAAMAEALVVAGSLPNVRQGLRAHGLALAALHGQDTHGEQLLAALQQALASGRATAPLRLVDSKTTTNEVAHHDDVAAWPERLLAASEHQLVTGNAALAARLGAAAACLAPDDVRVIGHAAAAHSAAEQPTQALACCERLAARGIDDANLHLTRAQALHALGRLAEAADAARRALAAGVSCADTLNRIGVMLFLAGDANDARRSFERALALQPDHSDASANLSALPAA